MLNVFLEGGPTSATSCLPSPSAEVLWQPADCAEVLLNFLVPASAFRLCLQFGPQ